MKNFRLLELSLPTQYTLVASILSGEVMVSFAPAVSEGAARMNCTTASSPVPFDVSPTPSPFASSSDLLLEPHTDDGQSAPKVARVSPSDVPLPVNFTA